MADDLEKRLAARGQSVVPDIDPRFADRLESQLRIEHAGAASKQQRRGWTSLPRLAAAALIVVAGVVGLAALAGDDAGVPVAVVDGDPAAPLDAPTEGNVNDGGELDDDTLIDKEESSPALTDPTVTPTPTTAEVEPTATPDSPANTEPVADPTATSTSTPTPTVVDASPTPVATSAVPTPTVPVATSIPATPTPVPTPTPTPIPEVTPNPVPSPTATLVPTPEPTPTPEREPAPIVLACEVRSVGDAVGVVCSWQAPVVDRGVAGYQVMRSLNGSEAVVVSQQRISAPLTYTDRDVRRGDQAIYLVQGVDADGTVVAASVREIVVLSDA